MSEPVLWPLDDHTRAKHRVLAAYLAAWLPVMGQQAKRFRGRKDPPRLLVVDGFAGPGRYETGEDGEQLEDALARVRAARGFAVQPAGDRAPVGVERPREVGLVELDKLARVPESIG